MPATWLAIRMVQILGGTKYNLKHQVIKHQGGESAYQNATYLGVPQFAS